MSIYFLVFFFFKSMSSKEINFLCIANLGRSIDTQFSNNETIDIRYSCDRRIVNVATLASQLFAFSLRGDEIITWTIYITTEGAIISGPEKQSPSRIHAPRLVSCGSSLSPNFWEK